MTSQKQRLKIHHQTTTNVSLIKPDEARRVLESDKLSGSSPTKVADDSPEKGECSNGKSRFGRGSTCERVATDWRVERKNLWKFFSNGCGEGDSLAAGYSVAVSLFAFPRAFLPGDDLFLTYASLGAPPRGHSTCSGHEITSPWKPIPRWCCEPVKGERRERKVRVIFNKFC